MLFLFLQRNIKIIIMSQYQFIKQNKIMILTHPQNSQRTLQSQSLNPSRIANSQPQVSQPPPNQRNHSSSKTSNQGHASSSPPPQHQHKHVHKKSFLNPSFIGAILAILALSFAFIFQYIIIAKPTFWIPALVIFLILFAMTQWSYFSTVCTHPGRVPIYYGMSSQLTQQMPRKYCLMCHNFKPQRTHHCSNCRTCVLNMDHHCPWVNNCVGFWNRKYFILFLVFITLGLILMSIVQIIVLVNAIKNAIQTGTTDVHFVLKIIIALITFPLTFMLIAFTIFHLKMVFNNTTTLQGLLRKRPFKQGELQQDRQKIDDYNVGKFENFQQVFGQNPVYWGIPIFGDGPKGNGTYFPKALDQNTYQTRQEYEGRPLTRAVQQYDIMGKANNRHLY